jgi:ABC-type multidrug transport system fused ATPase/permease subunit
MSSLLFLVLLLFATVCFFKNLLDSILPVSHFGMIRKSLYDQMFYLLETDLRFVRIGEFITILSYLPREIRYFSDTLMNVLPPILGFIFIIIFVFTLNFNAGFFLLIGFLLNIWIVLYSPTIKKFVCECRQKAEMTLLTNSRIAEDIIQVDQIIGNNMIIEKIKENNDQEDDHIDRYQKSVKSSGWIYLFLQLWNIFLLFFTGILIFCFGNHHVRTHGLRNYIVTIGFFTGVLWSFIGRITVCINTYQTVVVFYSAYLRMVEKSQPQFSPTPPSYIGELSTFPSWDVSIRNLSFRYSPESPYIFQNLSKDLPSGSHWILKGQSGSGKSTFLKLLMRFYSPTDGQIFLQGQPIDAWNVRSLRKGILFMNQDTPLFEKSIMENVRFGNSMVTDYQIQEVLVKYNLVEMLSDDKLFTKKTPSEILQRSCGVDGKNLSKGQQKIVLLARSLLRISTMNSSNSSTTIRILIMDEPFASLDPTIRSRVLMWMGEILDTHPKMTVIMTTHVMDDPMFFQRYRFQEIELQ